MVLKMVAPKYRKTLMPVTCWRMASKMPIKSGSRSRAEKSSPQVPCSCDSAAWMLANSAPANSGPPTFSRIRRALSSRLRSINQRGLSGMGISSRPKQTAGRMPAPNIQRQPLAMSQA